MKITIRKSRGINSYSLKVDNVLIENFENKSEALKYVEDNKDKLEDLKNKKVELGKKKPESVESK